MRGGGMGREGKARVGGKGIRACRSDDKGWGGMGGQGSGVWNGHRGANHIPNSSKSVNYRNPDGVIPY